MGNLSPGRIHGGHAGEVPPEFRLPSAIWLGKAKWRAGSGPSSLGRYAAGIHASAGRAGRVNFGSNPRGGAIQNKGLVNWLALFPLSCLRRVSLVGHLTNRPFSPITEPSYFRRFVATFIPRVWRDPGGAAHLHSLVSAAGKGRRSMGLVFAAQSPTE